MRSTRVVARVSFALVVLLFFAARSMFAINCVAVHHPPPSEADTAYLAGDYAKATRLYQADLAKSPGEAGSIIGLVHALLLQQKVQEAADALHSSSASAPESPALMTLRGEVELRQGDPQQAAATAVASVKLDSCNPQTLLLLSRLEELNSQYATARKMLLSAHQLDPEDPQIRLAWIRTLPANQRISEMQAYLAAPTGDSADERRDRQTDLDHLKAWATEPRKPCTMVSTATAAEIPFVPILGNSQRTIAFGLAVKINDHTARLAIDTSYNARLPIDGVSGILISRAVAQHSGLKAIYQNDVLGTGGQAPRSGFVSIADSVSIGDVVFHDCAVQVMDVNFANGAEGIIGLDILSNYLVTLDFPAKKMTLETLPARPQGSVSTNGLYNRYTAPEMKDYHPIFRSGSDLILPLSINGKQSMLFVADTAIVFSEFSPGAAFQLLNGRKDPKYEDRGALAKMDSSITMNNVQLSLGDFSWNEALMGTFDTSRFTDDSGMEISGMVGLKTLSGMTLHLDLRDGLVKFDSDPKRKSPLLF
ncbi:MAG: aspartyl protease family protein [Terracidiphilus sp.]